MRSNTEWIDWGKRDPLFGVATFNDANQRGGEHEWTDDVIYSMGEGDWRECYRRWKLYGVGNGRCIEIGCGVGRYTKSIATSFDLVEALDVSPDMIDYAKARIQSRNVRFTVTDGKNLPFDSQSVDAAFSTHVFQHFDAAHDGFRYFDELSRVLVEGGTMMIHLPIHQYPIWQRRLNRMYRVQYRLIKAAGSIKAQINRRKIRQGNGRLTFRLLSYELEPTFAHLEQIGFSKLEVLIINLPSRRELHHFLLATKMPSTSA